MKPSTSNQNFLREKIATKGRKSMPPNVKFNIPTAL